MFIFRLESALRNRKNSQRKMVDGEEKQCEVCLQNIPNYCGPEPGVICKECLKATNTCTRTEPLVVTRGVMNE